jgi:predicted  nucleic acid-binding Zn-ribbon protein
MNKTLANLIRLQELMEKCERGGSAAGLRKQIERVHGQLPEALLRRFEHLTQRGRLPVAQVSESGACGSCHLKLTLGDALRFRRPQDAKEDRALTCPFCGCFLYVATAVTRSQHGHHVAVSPRL